MKSQRIPKVNERTKYHLPKSDEQIHTKEISRGGKYTGRNKYNVNAINDADKQMLGLHRDRLKL